MMTQVGRTSYEVTRRDLPARLRWSPRATAREVWARHQDLLKNTGSLLATTGVTSALGFAYWAVAARLFSQQEVGYAAAALSAMTLLGTIGMFGLGTVLIGELPRRSPRSGLISAALLASGLGSLVLGLGFVIVAPHVSVRLGDIIGSAPRAALFCAGVVLTAVTFVFDQATIGLLRGGLQLSRNIAFSVAKIAGLLAAAIVMHDAFGAGILMSWVFGTAASLAPITVRLWRNREPILPKPDWGILRSLGGTAVAHNWLNLAIQVPGYLFPVLVALVVSPSANAAFYAAWTVVSALIILPWHLSMVLFAVASDASLAAARKLRFALRLSLLLGIPGMAALGLSAHLILTLYGARYASVATVPMWLLVLTYIPTIPRCFYIAVCRAAGRISRAAAILTIFAVMEVAAVVAGGLLDGLIGVSLGLLAVTVIQGMVTAPVVLRAAFAGGRHRRTVAQAGVAPAAVMSEGRVISETAGHGHLQYGVQPVPAVQGNGHNRGTCTAALYSCTGTIANLDRTDQDERDRQQAGIAALLSIAWAVAPTTPIPVISTNVRPRRPAQDRPPPRSGSSPARRSPRHHP